MPLFEYRCKDCSEIESAFRKVAEMNDCPQCPICGGDTKKIISRYSVHGDISPYYDDNLESFVTSKAHRRQVMKSQGVEENYGQGWHTSARKTRKA